MINCNKKATYLFLFVALCGTFWACTSAPEFPIEPVIGFKSITRSTLQQGYSFEDSTHVTISFTDGDGDLGDKDSLNVYVIDERDNFLKTQARIPFIPSQGAGNGIAGTIDLLLPTSCCIFPDGQVPCTASAKYPLDTLVYSLYIKDRAGHESNKIKTTQIVLKCN